VAGNQLWRGWADYIRAPHGQADFLRDRRLLAAMHRLTRHLPVAELTLSQIHHGDCPDQVPMVFSIKHLAGIVSIAPKSLLLVFRRRRFVAAATSTIAGRSQYEPSTHLVF